MIRLLPRILVLGSCLLVVQRIEAQTFTIAAAQGNAEIGKDRSSYEPATAGSSHTIPSWGKTADESSLTIAFNAENKFRLLPLSEAEVTTGGEGDSGSAWHRVVSLKIGKATFDHNAGTAPVVHLDCQTPTAVCGAVGTEYAVDATTGDYSVTSGHISVSSDQEGALTMSDVGAGGDVVYNPGKENTYSQASFSGTVVIDGKRFRASDANFTVAKKAGESGETAVRIDSGRLGDTGAGSYIIEGGKLTPVTGKAVAIHPQYLAAARREGSLNVLKAADHAANRPFGQDAALGDAAAEATRLRKELFNREAIREAVKKTVEAAEEASRNAAQSAAAASAANAASAARVSRPGY